MRWGVCEGYAFGGACDGWGGCGGIFAGGEGVHGEGVEGAVRFEEAPEKRGERFGFWWEEGGRFSLGAPLRVVDEGRGGIPEDEWRKADI